MKIICSPSGAKFYWAWDAFTTGDYLDRWQLLTRVAVGVLRGEEFRGYQLGWTAAARHPASRYPRVATTAWRDAITNRTDMLIRETRETACTNTHSYLETNESAASPQAVWFGSFLYGCRNFAEAQERAPQVTWELGGPPGTKYEGGAMYYWDLELSLDDFFLEEMSDELCPFPSALVGDS